MKAVVYDSSARRVALREIREPVAAGGEVLFTPAYAAICGSDLHMYGGSDAYGWVASPLVLGHEAAGYIDGGRELFVLDPYIPCGQCKMCRLGNTSTCMGPSGGRAKHAPPWSLQYGFRRPGAQAARMAVRRENLVPVPPGLPATLAALTEGAAVAVHALEVGRPLFAGGPLENAVVVGPGPVGLSATYALTTRGARTAILGLPRDAPRLERAGRLGAASLATSSEALEATVDEWTGGAGVDLVIEATGAEEAFSLALRVVRKGGVVVAVGIPGRPHSVQVREIVRGGVIVAGSYGVTRADLEATLALLARDVERSGALLDRAFPLTDADAAYRHAKASSGKVLIEVSP